MDTYNSNGSYHEKNYEQYKGLGMQFPVSSGQHHRIKETNHFMPSSKDGGYNSFHSVHDYNGGYVGPPTIPTLSMPYGEHQIIANTAMDSSNNHSLYGSAGMIPNTNYNYSHNPDMMYGLNNTNYSSPPLPRYIKKKQFEDDISSSITHMKLNNAVPKGQYGDYGANRGYDKDQQKGKYRFDYTKFSDKTKPRFLSPTDLASGAHAWARKDQLTKLNPIQSGMGMNILKKMGWKPGEGLGKDRGGAVEPLNLFVKLDKKGLKSAEEMKQKQTRDVAQNFNAGKHPVSLLNEVCLRNSLKPPVYDCMMEMGSDNKRAFRFKITVNGVEYKPETCNSVKKAAKVEAATHCLRTLRYIE